MFSFPTPSILLLPSVPHLRSGTSRSQGALSLVDMVNQRENRLEEWFSTWLPGGIGRCEGCPCLDPTSKMLQYLAGLWSGPQDF